MDRLDDRHAIVTGATRGIGLAIAQGFLEAGARVTLCGRKSAGVQTALETLDAYSDRTLGVAAHVGRRADIDRLVEQAESRFGPASVLVNNAGTNPYFGPIVDSDEAAWDKTMEVNLRGPYLLSIRCAQAMAQRNGGSIINIASVAGLNAAPLQGIYSVSKAGLIMLTKVLARELGAQSVRVNCICPGLVRTRLSQALWQDPERERSIVSQKALGRVGECEELVGAAVYFASDASSFTTGAVLPVDGGMVC